MVKNMDDPRNMIYGIITKSTLKIIDNGKSVVILTLPLPHSSPCINLGLASNLGLLSSL
jgi:hypothetical protein